jgi:hypothetical protein
VATNKKNTESKTPTLAVCGCGCGEHVAKGRTFRPGHDARHAGNVGRALAVDPKDATAKVQFDGLSEALQAKASGVQTRHADRLERKAKALEARLEREAAKADAA